MLEVLSLPVGPVDLLNAVKVIAAGEALLSPRITRRLIDHYSQQAPPDAESRRSIERLTPRETELFLLVARGLTNAELATQHHISLSPTKTTWAACWPSWAPATASN